MARNLNPRAKRNRRLGEKIVSHGEKAFSRRPYPPGQHGPKGSSRQSEYGVRLREKQKAQLMYGILERQFRRYVTDAKRRVGDTGAFLLQMLEMRLDSIVYRAGFTPSREGARQLIRHGHISVNGKRVNLPSFQLEPNDTVACIKRESRMATIQAILKRLENVEAPAWLSLEKSAASAKVLAAPTPEDLGKIINAQLIVEFYSR